VVAAEDLGQRIFGSADGATSSSFATGSLAPDGETLALIVSRGAAQGTPQARAREESALVFVGIDGTITGVVPLAAGELRAVGAWSPGGALIVTFVFGSTTNNYAIQVLDREGALRGSFTVNGAAIGAALTPAWSPDGRWLAYSGPGGVTVASMEGYPSYVVDTRGDFPAWRPR
jgi:hypothetical protein